MQYHLAYVTFFSVLRVLDFSKYVRLVDSTKLSNKKPVYFLFHIHHSIRCFQILTELYTSSNNFQQYYFSLELAYCCPALNIFVSYKISIKYLIGNMCPDYIHVACVCSSLGSQASFLNVIPTHSIKPVTVQVINHALLKKPNFLDLRLENY